MCARACACHSLSLSLLVHRLGFHLLLFRFACDSIFPELPFVSASLCPVANYLPNYTYVCARVLEVFRSALCIRCWWPPTSWLRSIALWGAQRFHDCFGVFLRGFWLLSSCGAVDGCVTPCPPRANHRRLISVIQSAVSVRSFLVLQKLNSTITSMLISMSPVKIFQQVTCYILF